MKWHYGQIITRCSYNNSVVPRLYTCLETRIYSKEDSKHFNKVLKMLHSLGFEHNGGFAIIETTKRIPIEMVRTQLRTNEIDDKIEGSNTVSSFWYPDLAKKYNE